MKDIVKYAKGHNDTQLDTLSNSEVGVGVLKDMKAKLDFAGDELQRMESEGGKPLNDKLNAKIAIYSKLAQRIKKVLNRTKPN